MVEEPVGGPFVASAKLFHSCQDQFQSSKSARQAYDQGIIPNRSPFHGFEVETEIEIYDIEDEDIEVRRLAATT
jgi:hypothetical protein